MLAIWAVVRGLEWDTGLELSRSLRLSHLAYSNQTGSSCFVAIDWRGQWFFSRNYVVAEDRVAACLPRGSCL